MTVVMMGEKSFDDWDEKVGRRMTRTRLTE